MPLPVNSLTEHVSFDIAAFSLETVKRAAYRYINRFAAEICVEGGKVICVLTYPPNTTNASAIKYVADFRKEVLDRDLRQSISEETAPMRNAILALAFSKTKLLGDE